MACGFTHTMGRKVSDTVWRYMIISPTMIQTEREEMTEAEKAIEAVRGLVSQSDSRRRFMERLESENREFKATIESMRAELLAEVQGAEDLLREVARLKGDIKSLKTNNKTLTANNQTLAGAVEHWRDAHRELTKINSDQAETIERLNGELRKEKSRVPPILSDVAALAKEIAELKRQLTSVRTARDNQSATIRRQQDEIAKLSDELDSLTIRNSELIESLNKRDLCAVSTPDPGMMSAPAEVVDAINQIDDLTVSSALRHIVSFLIRNDLTLHDYISKVEEL